jgi:hypothetical protein
MKLTLKRTKGCFENFSGKGGIKVNKINSPLTLTLFLGWKGKKR